MFLSRVLWRSSPSYGATLLYTIINRLNHWRWLICYRQVTKDRHRRANFKVRSHFECRYKKKKKHGKVEPQVNTNKLINNMSEWRNHSLTFFFIFKYSAKFSFIFLSLIVTRNQRYGTVAYTRCINYVARKQYLMNILQLWHNERSNILIIQWLGKSKMLDRYLSTGWKIQRTQMH